MTFTEHRFDPDYIRSRVAERQAHLKANRGIFDLLGFGLRVITERLDQDPRRYRDYGPYWPALKEVLNAHGADLGDHSDPLVSKVYRGATAIETLIMADEFRAEYLRTRGIGANRFLLDAGSGRGGRSMMLTWPGRQADCARQAILVGVAARTYRQPDPQTSRHPD
ncbi:hypothetical protein [uncultured Thiodictyon sp.]|uniref:hypothetical protein n=1 Tax=uncultured Thiodictyon sp. TaxID=1846217 RepID=UPI0025D8C1A2|nr:hypothetical protein [uncultured Thiodictyon sp.]